MSKLSAAVWGLAAGACAASAPACAENLLGFYVGGGLGESTVRSDTNYPGSFGYGYDAFYSDPRHHFAWKAIAGIRPISIIGAELEYIDFGHPGGDGGYYSYNYGPDSHPRAIAAFGVGHLPLPIPFTPTSMVSTAAPAGSIKSTRSAVRSPRKGLGTRDSLTAPACNPIFGACPFEPNTNASIRNSAILICFRWARRGPFDGVTRRLRDSPTT